MLVPGWSDQCDFFVSLWYINYWSHRSCALSDLCYCQVPTCSHHAIAHSYPHDMCHSPCEVLSMHDAHSWRCVIMTRPADVMSTWCVEVTGDDSWPGLAWLSEARASPLAYQFVSYPLRQPRPALYLSDPTHVEWDVYLEYIFLYRVMEKPFRKFLTSMVNWSYHLPFTGSAAFCRLVRLGSSCMIDIELSWLVLIAEDSVSKAKSSPAITLCERRRKVAWRLS